MVFDVQDAYEWTALVVEGQTTSIQAFDPEAHREFTLTFRIGDRSKSQYESGTGLGASRKVENVTIEMPSPFPVPEAEKKEPGPHPPAFSVDLKPLSKVPLVYAEPEWEELDLRRKVVLSDVSPGTYRLRIGDWHGWADIDGGPLFEGEVVVRAGGLGRGRHPARRWLHHGEGPQAEGKLRTAGGSDRRGDGEQRPSTSGSLRRRGQFLRPLTHTGLVLGAHSRPEIRIQPGGRRGGAG